jgi:hypothetical protein
MRIAQHLISGGTQTKAPPSIAAHIASNAIDFFRVMKKSQPLPLNAADRAWSNPIGIEKGGEHQSQILPFKRRTTCPPKRGRSSSFLRTGRGQLPEGPGCVRGTADKKIDGYTESRRFFLSFVRVSRENQTYLPGNECRPTRISGTGVGDQRWRELR